MNRLDRGLAFAEFVFLKARWSARISGDLRNYVQKGNFYFLKGASMVLGEHNIFEKGADVEVVRGKLSIGSHNYFNKNVKIACAGEIRIGNDCLFGDGAHLYDHDHDHREAGKLMREKSLVAAPIIIGNNVWVGARAIILKGVSIGDNAVVGAGAIVTRSVPANAVAAGNPARVLKMRS